MYGTMGNEVRQAFSISRVNSSVLDPYSSNPDPDPAKKIQSGSGSRKTLNPDPDPSYFLTLSEKNLNYFIIRSFYHQKKSI